MEDEDKNSGKDRKRRELQTRDSEDESESVNDAEIKRERPLQDRELKDLNRQIKQLDRNVKRNTRVLLIWILLAVVIGILAGFIIDAKDVKTLFEVVTLYIGIGVFFFVKFDIGQHEARKSIAFLKRKNLVTSVTVNSNKFYELKEEDDEGVYYLFQLDGNKVFSFGGQDFYPTKKFPSDRFEIVEGRGIDDKILLLEIYNSGKKIKPTRVITGKEKWDLIGHPNYPDPDKLTVMDGRIEDIVESCLMEDEDTNSGKDRIGNEGQKRDGGVSGTGK